jgi:hypothetical protein
MRASVLVVLLGVSLAQAFSSRQPFSLHPTLPSVERRQMQEDDSKNKTIPACSPLPAGHGPKIQPDVPLIFLQSSEMSNAAQKAPVPAGYRQTFSNLSSSSNTDEYLGYFKLDSYDPNNCTARCNAKEGCLAVNIYFQRDPTLVVGDECSNPPSTTNIKCSLWGSAVTGGNTVNRGFKDHDFQVVITGSNGYVKGSAPSESPSK